MNANKRTWSRVHLPNEDYDFIEWLANFHRTDERTIIMDALRIAYVEEKTMYDKINSRDAVGNEDPDSMASARKLAEKEALPTP